MTGVPEDRFSLDYIFRYRNRLPPGLQAEGLSQRECDGGWRGARADLAEEQQGRLLGVYGWVCSVPAGALPGVPRGRVRGSANKAAGQLACLQTHWGSSSALPPLDLCPSSVLTWQICPCCFCVPTFPCLRGWFSL